MLSMRSCSSMHWRTIYCERASPSRGSRSICASISLTVHDMTVTLSSATAASVRCWPPISADSPKSPSAATIRATIWDPSSPRLLIFTRPRMTTYR